jgi:hypothetical protein
MGKSISVRQEGPNVLLIIGGRATELPWNAALDVANALREKAKDAEEIAKAEGIIFDQALLIRTGAPLGFSSNPDIQKEAGKEAAWNSDLRRHIPGGVRATEQMGRPGVYHGRPERKRNGNEA